ncbi:MAG: hypothetical protein AB4058_05655 [Microcystaceae cyanobacterium]
MSKLIKPIPSLEEQRREQEKLHDTLLLLDHLFKREETTAKMILGNLYDIATVNLINNKVPLKMASPLLKLFATTAKPLASVVAVRAFQALCPKLIADYLYSLVEFKPQDTTSIEVLEIDSLSRPEMEAKLQQVKQLQGRVRFLTGSLVATLALFAGSSLFVAHRLGVQPQDIVQPTQTVIDDR